MSAGHRQVRASQDADQNTQLDLGTIGIIGTGRLGATLARALDAAGYQLSALACAHGTSAEQLAASLRARPRVCHAAELPEHASCVFVAVPDDALASVAASLRVTAGHRLVHTSGAQDVSVLQPAARAGATIAAFHPLQAFAHTAQASASAAFVGITIGIEAAEPLYSQLSTCCARLGASAISLAGVDRAAYHAAAVFASNYVVALHVAAARAFALSGLPAAGAQAALAPLTLGAAQNLLHAPLVHALTGPVVRGDAGSVARHLRALDQQPELRELYRALAAQLLQLPLPIDPSDREELVMQLADITEKPAK